eukprot:Skav225999  [mRNA]  locus=scaffold735:22560:22814:+ [translate_table: standard]
MTSTSHPHGSAPRAARRLGSRAVSHLQVWLFCAGPSLERARPLVAGLKKSNVEAGFARRAAVLVVLLTQLLTGDEKLRAHHPSS